MSRFASFGAALLLLAVLGVFPGIPAAAQSDTPIDIVAVDSDISGNTATSLGPLNACVRVEPGATARVDLVVDAVPEDRGVIGFQVNIEFDPNILTLTAVDNEFLLAAEGSYEPFEGLSDRLPDTDGNHAIIVADIASNVPFENIETGPGVLSRLTFAAKGTGVSTVAPRFNPPDEYPGLIDNQNRTIEVKAIGKASIAVGQDCVVPPEATPETVQLPPLAELQGTPTPTGGPDAGTATPDGDGDGATSSPGPGASQTDSPRPTATGDSGDGPGINGTEGGDGGGMSAATVAAVAALAVAGAGLAGSGGWMLYRRRSGGGAGA